MSHPPWPSSVKYELHPNRLPHLQYIPCKSQNHHHDKLRNGNVCRKEILARCTYHIMHRQLHPLQFLRMSPLRPYPHWSQMRNKETPKWNVVSRSLQVVRTSYSPRQQTVQTDRQWLETVLQSCLLGDSRNCNPQTVYMCLSVNWNWPCRKYIFKNCLPKFVFNTVNVLMNCYCLLQPCVSIIDIPIILIAPNLGMPPIS
jgi:hypothetical protein